MTAVQRPDPSKWFADQLAIAGPDLLREMPTTFVRTLMSAEADAVCGAEYGERSSKQVNHRNGYRHRDFDTRVGTIDLAIPKLLTGSHFPNRLLERRTRAERVLAGVVATCYLLGVSTRRMEKLVESLAIKGLSKSQVSMMACDLDEQVEVFHIRPLDQGPYTFVASDALVPKVRENGRVVNVHCLVATGVNADCYREILGVQVTSGAHAGLVAAIGATLPDASWQRCRTHYTANLMSVCPKSSWPWVRTLLHSVFDEADAETVAAQYGRMLDVLAEKLPKVAEHLYAARADLPARSRTTTTTGIDPEEQEEPAPPQSLPDHKPDQR